MTKKAQLAGAPNMVLTFVITVIVLAVAGMVVGGIKDSLDNSTYYGSSGMNATTKGGIGLQKFSTFLPTIAIVLVASLLIAIVVGAFAYFNRG